MLDLPDGDLDPVVPHLLHGEGHLVVVVQAELQPSEGKAGLCVGPVRVLVPGYERGRQEMDQRIWKYISL